MPARKLVRPSSNRQDRRSEPRRQTVFNDVYEDEPANILPDGALAKAVNAWCDGSRTRPRNGSMLWTSTPFPEIAGRTGYTGTKEGYYVNTSVDVFEKTDVSNLIGWENGYYDEIVEWINPQRVRVRDNDPNGGTFFLRGKINLWEWHRKKELWVLQLGEDLWTANREMTQYTQVLIISRDKPSNSFSEYKEFDDNCFVENSGGLFKIILTDSPPTAYRTNTDIPNERIESNESEGEKNHKYRYFYSAARLDQSSLFRSRNTPVKILTESGINKYFYEDESENVGDWAIINTEEPIGEGVETYGVLYSGPTLVVDATLWASVNDATVKFNINNLGYANIVFDFTAVTTMDDVASVIQSGIKRYFPSATCEFVGDRGRPRLKITSGVVHGGNVEYCLRGEGGTVFAADNLGLLESSGAVKLNPRSNAPNIVRGLKVPPVGKLGEYQWHWTHFPVYRTADYGPDGRRLKTNGKQTVNSPDYVSWVKDLRIAGAFIARRVGGIVELREGEEGGQFEKADEGTVIEFEDGTREELLSGGYIDSKHCRYSGAGQYYYNNSGWMAAMIGNGRVKRVSKVGTIITRYPGSRGTSFTSNDIRKPILFPNGTYSYIKRVINADSLEVWDDRNWDEVGITLDPTHRNFTDIVDDDQLYGYSAAWTAKNRFFVPIKVGDMISKQPGFLLTAPRYGKEVNYCQLELSYRQFVGYHDQNYQKMIIEDQIMALEDFPNRFSILCEGTIYTGVTNNAIEITIEGTLQKIFQLADVEKVADFGISDAGSIQRIGEGLIRMITNIDEIRDFDGINYGDDLAVDKMLNLKKIQRVIQNAYPQYSSIYSRINGYIWWWKRG